MWSNGSVHQLLKVAWMGALGFVLLAANSVWAIPANPDPSVWNNDDGSTVFGHQGTTLAIEQASIDSPPSLPIFFGFYFDGTGGTGTGGDGLPNAGIIFNTGVTPGQAAVIDFSGGQVLPAISTPPFTPTGDPPTSLFTTSPSGTGDIGFFIAVQFPGQSTFTTFFTDPTLNPGGFDVAGTFPALAAPNIYLVAFDLPSGPDTFIFAYSVALLPLTTVPEPSSVALVGLALLLAACGAGWRRRS